MAKTKGSAEGEMLDKAKGLANVAANNAAVAQAEVAPMETPSKRGRKPSNRMTVAKWAEMLKDGSFNPADVVIVPAGVIDGKYQWGSITYNTPIVNYGEDGSLSMVTLTTDRHNKPVAIPGKTRSVAEVIAFLSDAPVKSE